MEKKRFRLYAIVGAAALTVATLTMLTASPPLPAAGSETTTAADNPLSPPDTSSPRATLKSFLENFEAAYRPFYEEDEKPREAAVFRVLRTLDSSELPAVQRERLALEAAFQLYEVLARVDLPPYQEVPDAEQMYSLEDRARRGWRIPDTEIEIVGIDEGLREGEFLFSAQTLERAEEFYRRARDLPYRPGTMTGLYERIRYTAGDWFPAGTARALPNWLKATVFGQAIWKWIASLLTIAVWLVLVLLAHRLSRPNEGTPRYWLRFWLALAALPVTYGFREFLVHQVVVIGLAFELIDPALVVAFYFFGAVAILNLGAAVAQSIIKSPRIKLTGIEPPLVEVAGRAVAWAGVILLILRGADTLGIPLPAVIASLGVGGIALGLAARPTLENLIAGITMYLDKPVRVGEFCQFDDVLGTVEEIGLRSTRIRRWEGNLISVPNSQFAEYRLDNYNDVHYMLLRTTLGLRYETTTDQLRYVLAKLSEMLIAHSKIVAPRVRFTGFGDYALKIEVIGYCDTRVWTEWHAIREDVYLRAKQIVEEAGTAFAFPSQTTYYARDPGLNEERRRQAEERIEEWRKAGLLPFPNRSAEQVEEIANTIEYPEAGSVEYVPKT